MNVSDKGKITEAVVLSRLIERGYHVSIPFGHNHRYDLIVDDGTRLWRAQCKTAARREGVITFKTYSTDNYSHERRGYDDEIDVFLVYSPHTREVYWLKPEGLAREPYLRVEPPRDGRWRKDMLRAKDFELPMV